MPRKQPPRRRLRVLAVALLAMLAGTGGVVFGAAAPAAADPVFIVTPTEPTPITSEDWPYVGTGTPGDPIRVGQVGGPYCNTTVDAFGDWNCVVHFTQSGLNISVQAISIPHTGPGQVEDTKEYNVAREPTIFENTDSAFATNEGLNPYLTGTAEPLAQVDGTVAGFPCSTVADGAGQFTCTATAAPPLTEGTYFAGNQVTQRPPGFAFDSDPRSTWYIFDQSVTVPDATVPFDTNVTHANYQTSDTTPVISGANNTAEGQSNVIVYMYRYSTNGTVPAWPAPPPPAFGSTYCNAGSDFNGSWSCSGAPLDPGSVYVFGLSQIDLAGNGPPSPDSEFSIQILPPPSKPVIVQPLIGYQSVSDNTVHVSTTNDPTGVIYVREGSTNLCPSFPVVGPTYSCDTVPLSNGYHTIRVFMQDTFGTTSAVATRVVHIGPYPPKVMLLSFAFSFTVLGPDGTPVGPGGLHPGDAVTIQASGLPVGTVISAEIHSTPVGLGSATIGPTGTLTLPATIPADIDDGDHEIVLAASAPGYAPATFTSPVAVHRKVLTGGDDTVPPDLDVPEKQVGEPHGPGNPGPGNPGSSAHGFTDPSVFGSSLESPYDADAHAFALTAAGIVLSGSIAIVFLLFVGFPAELLESTIRSNYDRAFGWVGRLRRRVHRMLEPIAKALSNQWVATGLSILAASFVLGFADPDFGFNGASVRLFLAMIISVLTINVGLSLIVMRVAKKSFDVSAVLKPMPAAIAIVALSVVVSRILGISPGFLFGVVLGVAYARELKLQDEARLGVLGVGLTIAAGIIAWLGYGLASLASGPGFFNNLLIEATAAITLEALGTLVIAMLPIEFLDGKTIFRWSKLAWFALYAVTLLVFLFVVVPLSDNWGVMSAPVLGFGTLFAAFAVVAVATWAIFTRRARTSSREAAAPRRRARR